MPDREVVGDLAPRRSFWGWGDEARALDGARRERLRALLSARFDVTGVVAIPPPRLEELVLPEPRFALPPALRAFTSQDLRARAGHTYGKAFRDIARALRRDFSAAPDAVAVPRNEAEIAAALEWCGAARVAVIPYGGGTSVVGGVEPRVGARWNGALTLDLRRLDRIIEVDRTSRAARIECGIRGPALEDALRSHGLTLRHYPQSFEFSTLGGWIATRAAGHYATLHTRIDDFVESLRVVTPRGTVGTRRVPSTGAGPSAEHLFLGSEGALGIITEAWLRVQEEPRFRAAAAVRFAGWPAAVEAVRRLAQSGLHPSNCRLLDRDEALHAGVGDGTADLLLVAFESSDHPVGPWMERALAICAEVGGVARAGPGTTTGVGAAADAESAAWRTQFLEAPYLRDALALLGFVVETFETAVTWDRFATFHENVLAAVRDALRRICGGGTVTARLTHAYPDGAAPYYTVVAPARPGSQLEQWDEIKAAASEAILAGGGTITHHHAVGRDHVPWYERERPPLLAEALRAAKAALDPAGVLNPGALLTG